MFQNVLVTALTPLSNTNELSSWENRPFSSAWPDDNRDIFRGVPNKLKTKMRAKKRFRTQFRTDQLLILEQTFMKTKFIDRQQRINLCSRLKIDERCIKIWFQNRRMKEKKEKESSDLSDNSSTSDTSSYDQCNANQYLDNGTYQDYLQQQYLHSNVYRTSQVFYQQADSTSHNLSDFEEKHQNNTEIQTVNEPISSTSTEPNHSEDFSVPRTEYCQENSASTMSYDCPQETTSYNEFTETYYADPYYLPFSDAYNLPILESTSQDIYNRIYGTSNVYTDFMSDTNIYPTQYYSNTEYF